jgi:hypothetical protein
VTNPNAIYKAQHYEQGEPMLCVRYVCLITAVSLFIVGCTEDSGNADLRHEIDGLRTQVNALQAELKQSNAGIDATQAALLQISRDLRIRIERGKNSVADDIQSLKWKSSLFDGALFVNPVKSSNTWQAAKSSIGVLALSCLGIGNHEDGSRVTLFIGNPFMATLSNVEAYVEYGELDELGRPRYEGSKSKSVTFAEALKPAKRTIVTFILDDIQPSKLGFLKVYIRGPSGISFP